MHRAGRGKLAKKATRELPEEDPEFQIAPMIDILLVLLVFFMSISSTEVLQTSEDVRLPVAKEGKRGTADDAGLITVNVLWNPLNNVGSIEVSGKNYNVAQDLVPEFQKQVSANPECLILIRADKEVKYDYLRSILKAAGGAGATNITFSVVNRDDQ